MDQKWPTRVVRTLPLGGPQLTLNEAFLLDLFVLFSQLYEVHLLLVYLKAESTLVKVGYLLLLELRLTVLYLALFIFARSHLLVGSFYIVTVKLFLLKLEQVETYISEIGRQ